MDKHLLQLQGTTVPMWSYSLEGLKYVEFDTSACEPPEPMVNLMHALKSLKGEDDRVVMINMQEPEPLYPRLSNDLQWEVTPLKNGDVRIVFRLKEL